MADRVRAAVAGTLVVLTLAACQQGDSAGPVTAGIEVADGDGLHGSRLTEPYEVPDLSLTATDGSSYSLRRDGDAALTLVFFGYTHCPDICQVVMADITSAMARLDDRTRGVVDMLFVTSDPARDDPATLREYLDRFDPAFEGLTGDLDTIIRVADALGVPIERGRRMPSGGYEVAHGTQVVGIDRRDRGIAVWTEGTSAAQFADDIVALRARTGSSQ